MPPATQVDFDEFYDWYVDHAGDSGLKTFFSSAATGSGTALKGLGAGLAGALAGALAAPELTEEAKQATLGLIGECTVDSEFPSAEETVTALINGLMSNPSLIPPAIKALADRLGQDSIPVKTKAMMVVRVLCERGPPSFHNQLRSDEAFLAVLAQLLQFECPPHPKYGDKPQQIVRQTASALLEQVKRERLDLTMTGMKSLGMKSMKVTTGQKRPSCHPRISDTILQLLARLSRGCARALC